jgi:hypothetical protein
MDAARLVAQAERAMGSDLRPEEIVAEAWQAYELTEAVVRLLDERATRVAGSGPPGHPEDGYPDEARRSGAGPGTVPPAAGGRRAARLTTVRDPDGTLRALRVLLGEIGLAVVDLIGSAADEQAYWSCVEAMDAVDEAKDRLRELARVDAG